MHVTIEVFDEGECIEPREVEDILNDIHELFGKKGIPIVI
ncbi:hypothetical protein Krac_1949 [Ktedonobacter racemifer DSM 44963]|uniref:Uncharacterized protein n=1 Tax=Ktedonobacter racemifer DSM 44963 TaxID=485913 RepID=D6U405_KTERA|nr:hypothetical protein Krac_1949 [Ktedonobacter racemifer DSM 44963]